MTRSVKKDAPLPLFLPRWNPPAPRPRHDQVHPPKGIRHQIVQEQGAPVGRDRPPSTRRHPRDADRIFGLDGPAAQSIQAVPHPVERAASLVIREERPADPEGARFLGGEEARLAFGVLPEGRPVRWLIDPRLGEEGVSNQGAPPWRNDSADPVPVRPVWSMVRQRIDRDPPGGRVRLVAALSKTFRSDLTTPRPNHQSVSGGRVLSLYVLWTKGPSVIRHDTSREGSIRISCKRRAEDHGPRASRSSGSGTIVTAFVPFTPTSGEAELSRPADAFSVLV